MNIKRNFIACGGYLQVMVIFDFKIANLLNDHLFMRRGIKKSNGIINRGYLKFYG